MCHLSSISPYNRAQWNSESGNDESIVLCRAPSPRRMIVAERGNGSVCLVHLRSSFKPCTPLRVIGRWPLLSSESTADQTVPRSHQDQREGEALAISNSESTQFHFGNERKRRKELRWLLSPEWSCCLAEREREKSSRVTR